jgi:hypothetical protein
MIGFGLSLLTIDYVCSSISDASFFILVLFYLMTWDSPIWANSRYILSSRELMSYVAGDISTNYNYEKLNTTKRWSLRFFFYYFFFIWRPDDERESLKRFLRENWANGAITPPPTVVKRNHCWYFTGKTDFEAAIFVGLVLLQSPLDLHHIA